MASNCCQPNVVAQRRPTKGADCDRRQTNLATEVQSAGSIKSMLSARTNQMDKSWRASEPASSKRRLAARGRSKRRQPSDKGVKMINSISLGFALSAGSSLLLVLSLITIPPHARCQEFEDLKNNNVQKQAPNLSPANFQQPFQASRQPQFPTLAAPHHSDQNAAPQISRSSVQRPVLSSRFAPQQQQQQQQQQAQLLTQAQLSAQASTNVASVAALNQQPAAPQPSQSNIEAIMRNALARSAKFEGLESRQDTASAPLNELASQSRSGAQFQGTSPSPVASPQRERASEPNESQASSQTTAAAADENADKPTTVAQNGPADSHETVYSDQRFANLFARRGAAKKAKFTPTEQVKAKPTLPSFIKSLPDPKQFTSNPADALDRPITPASTNLLSARLQQQQQQLQSGQARGQKKNAALVSASPVINANANKRNQAQKAPAAPTGAAAAAGKGPNAANKQPAGQAAPAGKPAASSSNPFSKSQVSNNSDPANVIAMARRRLLANNALQQRQQAN